MKWRRRIGSWWPEGPTITAPTTWFELPNTQPSPSFLWYVLFLSIFIDVLLDMVCASAEAKKTVPLWQPSDFHGTALTGSFCLSSPLAPVLLLSPPSTGCNGTVPSVCQSLFLVRWLYYGSRLLFVGLSVSH